MKALFVDFEDSFSYNLIQELTEVGFVVSVVNWKDFEDLPEEGLLVLGPGPGHPDDYAALYPLVKEWLRQKKPFFGVCLGHQIFWRLREEPVVRSREPLHGQKVLLALSEEWREWFKLPKKVYVQRYNSLCVPESAAIRNPELKSFIQQGEVLITRSSNALTYQFHPESIGTTFRKTFFDVLSCIIAG